MHLVVAIYSAKGGNPGNARPKKDPDGRHSAGRTHAGTFVLDHTGKHVSGTWTFSKVRWGVPIKPDPATKDVLYEDPPHHWHSVRKRLLSDRPHPETIDVIGGLTDLYVQIQRKAGNLTPTKVLPGTWVFNDFGHATWYMVRLLPGGRRSPRIHPEFIHTTQIDEYQSANKLPITLEYSHGCIHIRPPDMDDMMRRGYLRTGNHFVVHKYNVKPALAVSLAATGKKFRHYEVHFFPGVEKIAIYAH